MNVSERKALFDMATRVANGNNLYLSHVLESLVEQKKLERVDGRKSKTSGRGEKRNGKKK